MDERTLVGSRLDGKACFVTGGGSGIGRATAVEMALRGARAVAICDIAADDAAETARLVEAAGAKAAAFRCDVSDEDSVRATIDAVAERFAGLDVLHNNAGIVDTQVTDATRIEEIRTDDFDRIFAVNVRGTWLCMKYAIPHLRRSPGAAIVNCASISGLAAFPGETCYCASKAAVILLTQSAALDLRGDGIRCNCYCPGTVETPLIATFLGAAPDPDAARRMLGALHLTPEPRLAAPEEIARVVCFLACDDASFVNGAAIVVDAGAMAWRGAI